MSDFRSSDLVAFLRARLDEDEREARAAFSGQADPENGWGIDGRAVSPHVGVIHEEVQRVHVAKWNPARVLAEVQAKRAILDLADEASADHRSVHLDRCCVWECGCAEDDPGDKILKHLAAVYSWHPDFRPEWRPQ